MANRPPPQLSFAASFSLAAALNNADECAANIVPWMRFTKITVWFVVAAFALHVRLVWCRVQPMLVIALLVAAVALRNDRHHSVARPADVFDGAAANRLSSYERARYRQLQPRWHLTLVAYAAWIAYGALFHEGRHAAEDLALLDGLLMPSDIGSATLVSFLRVSTLTLLSCASMMHEVFLLDGRVHIMIWLYALLLVVPPVRGVPQVLGVSESLFRCATFLAAFLANELWRCAVEQYSYIATASSRQVDELLDASRGLDFDNSKGAVLRLDAADDAPPPASVASTTPVSLHTLSLLRAGWLLTAPNNYAAFFASAAICGMSLYCTPRWSDLAINTLRMRSRDKTQPAPAAAAATPAAKPTAAAPAAAAATTVRNRSPTNSVPSKINGAAMIKKAATEYTRRNTAVVSSEDLSDDEVQYFLQTKL